MSVTRTMVDGLNVFTVTSDPHSLCPPLCQILKGLCHTPACCSVSQALKRVQNASMSLLGALHFVVGLLTIGLACVVGSGGATWDGFGHSLFPLWIGGMFMLLGLLSILSEKCPTPCLVLANVILNVIGLPLAIISIVLYCISMAKIQLWWMCHLHEYPEQSTPAPSLDQQIMMDRCLRGEDLVLTFMIGMHALLIILTVLELCVIISCIVLGVKGLKGRETSENMSTQGPEPRRTLLEEGNTYPPA
ncbi:membrane-spanning 4-domains subfamily A member 3-like [Chaetodon trifascialis]|uniref:membrane-spanning 4-domains subfamily A member 3-like n=1 Tax=Chaetodon trifascialis TaxID=109706 RepID=UPI0039938557